MSPVGSRRRALDGQSAASASVWGSQSIDEDIRSSRMATRRVVSSQFLYDALPLQPRNTFCVKNKTSGICASVTKVPSKCLLRFNFTSGDFLRKTNIKKMLISYRGASTETLPNGILLAGTRQRLRLGLAMPRTFHSTRVNTH